MAKTKTLSFSVWKTLFRDTLSAFPKIWWRVASVNIFTILTLLLGTMIFAGIGFVAFGNTLENMVANIALGGSMSGILPLIGLVVVWAVFIMVFSMNGKMASTLVMKNYVKKQARSSFKLYFVDAWHYLGRYIVLVLNVIWYLFWPVILVLGAGTIIMTITNTSLDTTATLSTLNYIVYGGGIALILVLFIWRLVNIAFLKSTFVHFDKKEKPTFSAVRQLVKGHWWGVLISMISFFFVANIVRVIFLVPEYVLYGTGNEFNIFSLIDALFSFFVLAPLIISFMYLFMLHLSKTKKVKP
jgi:hypothetical protein